MVADQKELERKLKKLYAAPKARIDLGVFLAEVVEEFGGPRALARELVGTYRACVAKPFIRQKILMMVQQLIHAATLHDLTGRRPAAAYNDADLQDEIHDYLSRIHRGEITAPALADPGGLPGLEADPGLHPDGGVEHLRDRPAPAEGTGGDDDGRAGAPDRAAS
jgi:hypothetical protein